MAAINPRQIKGDWVDGYALDIHTTGSVYLGVNEYGHDVYDTTRSEVGELLYRLKYRADLKAAEELVAVAATYIGPNAANFDVMVPVPPSGVRAVQPVITLANGIGAALKIPVANCIVTTRPPTQLKGVVDPQRRRELLDGLYALNGDPVRGRRVLLFDDLFRSGSTMNAITNVLMGQGGAVSVHAFTITRTRSNQ